MTAQGTPAQFGAADACYFDGDHPVAETVGIRLIDAGQTLEMTRPSGETARWPAAEVRRLPDVAGKTGSVLRWTGDPLARLMLTENGVLRHLPYLNRHSPPRGRGRLALWAMAAVAAVAVQIGVLVPLLADNLADLIPPEGEQALGEATFGHIRTALDDTGLNPIKSCDAPAGRAALDRMVARLNGNAGVAQPVTVSVLDHEMFNAFALPGGFVVVFRGLIDAANSADEVAAVLAHEIGHVASRDPTRHALRSAGSIGILGLLFGDFAGGTAVLFMTERLIAAQYSQAAETGADTFAHALLSATGVNPAALGDMFATMRSRSGDHAGIQSHFLSHPGLGARIAAARAAVIPDAVYTPVLSAAEWRNLQAICRN